MQKKHLEDAKSLENSMYMILLVLIFDNVRYQLVDQVEKQISQEHISSCCFAIFFSHIDDTLDAEPLSAKGLANGCARDRGD